MEKALLNGTSGAGTLGKGGIFSSLRYDFPSGLAVFLVAVPLCLGVAHASGAPLLSGIISGALGGLVVGALSKSQLAVSGPAAGLTAVVLTAVTRMGGFQPFLVALVLAGLLQIAFGYLKAGVVARFMPASVIQGMLAAIGLLLILKQFPHLIGYDVEEMGVFEFADTRQDLDDQYSDDHGPEANTFTLTINAFRFFKTGVVLIGGLTLGLLFLWDKTLGLRFRAIPGSLLVVPLGAAINALYHAFWPSTALGASHLVHLPKVASISEFVSRTAFPAWDALSNPTTYKVAATLAIVASLETLLSIDAMDRLDPQKRNTPPNRELMAQGVGNTLAGLLGGLPLTAVIVRGSVNLAAGARSKLSALIHGGMLVLAAALLTPLINRVPLATLAAILVYTGFKLASLKTAKKMWSKGWSQFAPFAATVATILLTDLLVGIGVGLAVAVVFILRNNTRGAVLDVMDYGKIKKLVLGEDVTFLHKAKLEAVLDKIPPNSVVEIDGSRSRHVDAEVIDVIEEFRKKASQKNIQLLAGGIPGVPSLSPESSSKMDTDYLRLIKNNQQWVKDKSESDPTFFQSMAEGQTPHFLFIGCSDSRVPVDVITRTEPGDIFVHRNIANVVSLTDINGLSVIQYSVDVLKVRHIIVCGHYGCGGVKAALSHNSYGIIDNWITHIKEVIRDHQDELDAIGDPEKRERRLVELHVLEQVRNLCKTSIVQNAIRHYGFPHLHGWVYDIQTGLIQDLGLEEEAQKGLSSTFQFK